MSSVLSSHEGAVKLLFDSRTYVAGERIFGVVELDFRKTIEDKIEQVRVKLRGTASTRITRSRGQSTVTYRSSLPLARGDMILWTQGTYPPAGEHIMQLPFEFQIPRDSPGSFHSDRYRRSATISYGIEVVADRPGIFRFKPSVERSSEIRKRFWGEYSRVQAQFQYPALNSFPVGIRIPISIIVTTTTKTMKKSETPADAFSPNPDKPLFPPPPQGPEGVRLLLDALVHIKARGRHESMEDHLPSSSGLGAPNTNSRHVRVTPSDPVWLPEVEKGEEGKWKREVRFDTTMLLTCPPTFDLDIIKCSYELNVEITFPGLGNNLEFQIPIRLNSGFGPFDPNAPPPPALDLPPSYFTGEHHDWDGDEKSG
ncbi:hypothetical protein BKA70DRAFT_1250246 [Coprinopsis sp. MPI-PUGE-AT-0042]|nr:hypothetical protein BKA70DRAFT_1250246 [Coprinopsis sp. MPI-PUGE-AT-0042]